MPTTPDIVVPTQPPYRIPTAPLYKSTIPQALAGQDDTTYMTPATTLAVFQQPETYLAAGTGDVVSDITAALVAARDNGTFILRLGPGNFSVGPLATQQSSIQGTSFVLDSSFSNITIKGSGPGITNILPISNEIEIIAQAGANNVTVRDLTFNNSANGVLQNQVKQPLPPIVGGGIATLGNEANCAIRQYFGAGLTVQNCSFEQLNTCIAYIGDYTDITILSGVLVVQNIKWNACCFGILPLQPETMTMAFTLGTNFVNSVNATSTDPGHQVYLSDRPGAAPKTINIINVQDYNGQSSAVKIRKGETVAAVNLTVDGSGRGAEFWNCLKLTLVNFSAAIVGADPDGDQCCLEISDCGVDLVDNCVLDARGTLAWCMRVRNVSPAPSNLQPNTRSGFSNITCLFDYADGNGKAPVLVTGQSYADLTNIRLFQDGTIAGARYPFDIRNSQYIKIINPRRAAPDGPTDAFKLASFDSSCVGCEIEYSRYALSVAPTSSTISDAGTGTEVIQGQPGGGLLQATAIGSAAAPALGILASGDSFGYFRKGSNEFAAGLNGFELLQYFQAKLQLVVPLLPATNGGVGLGSASQGFSELSLAELSAAPSNPGAFMLAVSDGTPGSNGWGASGAGLYKYSGSSWTIIL